MSWPMAASRSRCRPRNHSSDLATSARIWSSPAGLDPMIARLVAAPSATAVGTALASQLTLAHAIASCADVRLCYLRRGRLDPGPHGQDHGPDRGRDNFDARWPLDRSESLRGGAAACHRFL